MKPSLQDIADHLGLSKMTVSRALGGGAGVNAGTRQRVRAYAERIGYAPNPLARALVTGRTHLILLYVDISHVPFYAKVIHHVQREARFRGYEVLISEMAGARPGESGEASRWPVDGILAIDNPNFVQSLLGRVRPRAPVVNMGAFDVSGADFVGVDLYAGGREAMAHLLSDPSRRRVAYVAHERSMRPGEARYDAYGDSLREAGLTAEFVPVAGGGTRAQAREAVRAYVAEKGCPDAVFCRDDLLALGAHRALKDLGHEIGRKVALVGCDGIEDTEFVDPAVTTIVQPIEEMCANAWDLLERRLRERQERGVLSPRRGNQAGGSTARVAFSEPAQDGEVAAVAEPVEKVILTPRLEIRESS